MSGFTIESTGAPVSTGGIVGSVRGIGEGIGTGPGMVVGGIVGGGFGAGAGAGPGVGPVEPGGVEVGEVVATPDGAAAPGPRATSTGPRSGAVPAATCANGYCT